MCKGKKIKLTFPMVLHSERGEECLEALILFHTCRFDELNVNDVSELTL